MQLITHDDLDALAIGAGILGTGGGGNPYIGKIHAQRLLADGGVIQVIPPDEVDDTALITTVGFIGSPVVSVERIKRGDEPLRALRGLEAHIGRAFDYVIPGEIGGANSMSPMTCGAMAEIPVVDGDGMGRAFPELQMDTFAIYGIPMTPAAIADPRDHFTLFDRLTDAHTLERYARAVTIEMGGSAGYAFPVMTGLQLKQTVVPGTISLAIDLGNAVLEARQRNHSAIDAILDTSGGEILFTGKISDVNRRLLGGFARGTVIIDGVETDQHSTLTIEFQNEYLIARDDNGHALAVVPDLICIVATDDGEPVTTEILRYGMRVTVIGVPAPEAIRTPRALEVIGPEAFGYPDIEYRPMSGTFGNRPSRMPQSIW